MSPNGNDSLFTASDETLMHIFSFARHLLLTSVCIRSVGSVYSVLNILFLVAISCC